MVKLTGLKKIKTAVFISGTGSNLKNLIKFSKIKNSPISIDLIFSNTPKAKGLKFSNQFNIKKYVTSFKDSKVAIVANCKPILVYTSCPYASDTGTSTYT